LGRRPEDHVVGRGLRCRRWPCHLDVARGLNDPVLVFLVTGILLPVIGIPMLVVAARAVTITYHSDRLATTGLFGIVIIVFRHWPKVPGIQGAMTPPSNAFLMQS
jgi:hypothetical protein